MGAPSAQNLISFSLNGGVVVNGPVPGRANDSAGINVGFGQVSSQAAALDRETAKLSGGYDPVRGGEILVEVTYQAQLNPWLQLQPVAQFVANPGGGILDPADGTRKLPNEVVVGMRANVSF
jgi:porin